MSLFLEKVVEDGYTSYNITKGGYVLVVVLAVIAFLAISYFINADGKGRLSVKQLTVSALCLALAFVLSNVKLFKLPMGGSVTVFSMFFVTYIGYLYGPRVSLSAAFAYGLLQMIVDPYIKITSEVRSLYSFRRSPSMSTHCWTSLCSVSSVGTCRV